LVEDAGPIIRLIAESWDDPVPVLVFADWAEDHGGANPALLRWYAREVMPTILATPADCPPLVARVTNRESGRKSLLPHPNADILLRLAAVAFCRRPFVWNRLLENPVRQAVTVARFFVLGMATAADRRAIRRAVHHAQQEFSTRIRKLEQEQFLATGVLQPLPPATARPFLQEFFSLHLARILMIDTGPPAGPAVATCFGWLTDGDLPSANAYAQERGYHKALYEALATVPPLVQEQPFASSRRKGILRILQE
jgi:hypothetical protein